MENKKYKLVALDIDGTTVKNDGTLSINTIETIKKCIVSGVPVCLCTGRNLHNTKKIAKTLSKDMPFVCADGSILYDNKHNKIIEERIISKEIVKEIAKIADNENLYMEFCSPKKYYKYVKNQSLEKFCYGGFPKSTTDKFDHYFIRHIRNIKNLDKFVEKGYHINQFLIGGEIEDIEKFKRSMENKKFDNIELRYDLWENYVFVVPKDVNKSYGLNMLSNHFDIAIDDMIAIGDQMNDIDMIKKAGLGIAMGNAHDSIKENAKFITKSNEDDGVAFAINKFIFGE